MFIYFNFFCFSLYSSYSPCYFSEIKDGGKAEKEIFSKWVNWKLHENIGFFVFHFIFLKLWGVENIRCFLSDQSEYLVLCIFFKVVC